jgi:hypothetical protein
MLGVFLWMAGASLGAVTMTQPGANPAGEELRDILPPVEEPYWTARRVGLAVMGGGLGAGLLGWAFVAWLRRNRPPPLPPDPVRVAMKALDALRGSAGEEMTSRDFAAAVGEVLRRYWEASRGVLATRQTTEEFLQGIEQHPAFGAEQRQRVSRFLGLCDRLKFGGEQAQAQTRRELIASVEEELREAQPAEERA